MPTNRITYTAPINPSGATSVLTQSQVWSCLQRKIRAGQDFVGGAIISTDVIEEKQELGQSGDDEPIPVTVREVLFRDGNRRVREVCKAHEPMKVEFFQPDGSLVCNIISEGAEGAENGDLWMTYTFQWRMPGIKGEELEEQRATQKTMAKIAVEESIKASRRLVESGEVK